MVRVLAAVLLAAALLAACGNAPAGEPVPGARPGLMIGEPSARTPAPSQSMPLLVGEGELGIPDLRGQVVVVNFWASWCAPCRTEQPDLNDAYELLAGDDVAFLGVTIQDTEPNALAHKREFGVPYDSLFDPSNAYAARYGGVGPRAIPTTIVIDREGRVAVRLFGTTTADELGAVVGRLLNERPAQT